MKVAVILLCLVIVATAKDNTVSIASELIGVSMVSKRNILDDIKNEANKLLACAATLDQKNYCWEGWLKNE
ncbi:hypothetical protein RRG08_035002 [Elysia crispata]|uniref:Uncharacterized protein n=1 Tax=Elysia crispata TaxID=231223 RepID=A0AAE1DL96_9GAST|nr:hypothetical protein RRG08_035002 [Elysia crispata]